MDNIFFKRKNIMEGYCMLYSLWPRTVQNYFKYFKEKTIPNLFMYLPVMYFCAMQKNKYYIGLLEPVLLNLLYEKKRMYGYEVTQKVKVLTKGRLSITEGALYPLLHRLEAEGVLQVETENIGNRIRKYYSLTKQGRKQKTNAIKELRSFMDTLQLLINPQTT